MFPPWILRLISNTYLRFKDVSINNDDDRFLKWISACCTCMKELLLKDCVGVNNLIIESSSLESIWYESRAYNDKRHVNISCDRLEKLHFNAPMGGRQTDCIRNVKVLILHPDIVQRLWLNWDNWKSKEISFISQTKEVVIQYQCRSYVIEFAYYILGHAHDLERMTIYYPGRPDAHKAVMKLRTEVMAKGIPFYRITTGYDIYRVRSLLSSIRSLDDFV
ncbi:hypothetical protein C1H46_036718 [Malus baccata]|uniref:FBD domain-containing protein n=1 Tax=Malus baccata TaxID=106549 RepID=A0A540KU28_MALBA|nr:hypothetical protein C1H46_036718 [Malus baccata]